MMNFDNIKRQVNYFDSLLNSSVNRHLIITIKEAYKETQMLVVLYMTEKGDIKIKLRQKEEAIKLAKKKEDRLIGLYLLGKEVTDLI